MQYSVINTQTNELVVELGEILAFDTGERAARVALLYTERTGIKHKVYFAGDSDWPARERNRFVSGEYLHVAWENAPFWQRRTHEQRMHFAHRSKEKPYMIAFTENDEKGRRDIQTRIKAGAYLKRYFGDVLEDSEISRLARIHAMASGESSGELSFAANVEDIVRVYENGPDSCMSQGRDNYASPVHPVSVYGDSDLQLAYIEAPADYHDNDIMARALVWPERKIYGRVYPTPERYYDSARDSARAAHYVMVQALEAAGYSAGRFDGAKISKIECDGGFVLPYLDGSQSVIDRGECFEISRHGEIDATSTNGISQTGAMCDNCEELVRDDNLNTVYTRRGEQVWCENCRSNDAFYCYGTEEYYSDHSYSCIVVDGEQYSEEYVRENFYYCERSEEWISDYTTPVFVSSEITQDWGPDYLSEAFFCAGTRAWYAEDAFERIEIDGKTYEMKHARDSGLIVAEETETA